MRNGLLKDLLISSSLLFFPLSAMAQHQGRTLVVDGRPGQATVAEIGGRPYVEIAGLAEITHGSLSFKADRIVLIFGLLTLVTTVYILRTLPEFLARFCLWWFTHTVYKIRIVGNAHVPARGPALLICNHMSFVDGLLVSACIQRFIRFLVYKPVYEHKALNWFMRLMKAIPVAGGNPKAVFESIERAREELKQGHIVCIFAEGAITRTGNLLPFKRGFERIVKDLAVPVIPDNLSKRRKKF